jgi:hypothetical protein
MVGRILWNADDAPTYQRRVRGWNQNHFHAHTTANRSGDAARPTLRDAAVSIWQPESASISSARDLTIVDASRDGYRETTRVRVVAPNIQSVTGPSIANGRLYIRNPKEIAAFELRSST